MVPKLISERPYGELTLRLLKADGAFLGVILGGPKGPVGPFAGASDAEVWSVLYLEAGKLNAAYCGYDGARNRFGQIFPDGFADSEFYRRERDWKVEAKRKLDATAPLAEAATRSGFGKAVLQFSATPS